MITVRLEVNGGHRTVEADDRDTLAELLRDRLGLTGTRLGCEHGVCGSCTVIVDGAAVRSCLLLAGQADGTAVTTVEGLSPGDDDRPAFAGVDGQRADGATAGGHLTRLQRALSDHHGLQCGFCTPGFVMLLTAALAAEPDLADRPDRLEAWMSSNLCRCTGYAGIRRALLEVARAGGGAGR